MVKTTSKNILIEQNLNENVQETRAEQNTNYNNLKTWTVDFVETELVLLEAYGPKRQSHFKHMRLISDDLWVSLIEVVLQIQHNFK